MEKNILSFQLCSELGNMDANFKKVQGFIENFYSTSDIKPDIIVLPEVWPQGWSCELFLKCSDNTNKTEDFLSSLAKKYNVNIIGGSYIRNNNGVLKNTCPVINRKGEIVARYEKIHLYAPDGEADDVKSGTKPVLVDIEGLKIGLSICYDIRFPELFRSYINSKFPPELMINMSAWPKTRRLQYQVMAQSRAVENQCYFLALSQTGEIKDNVYNSGYSCFVEPMGEIVEKLDENEGYMLTTLDMERVYKVRNTFPNLLNRKVYDFGFVPEILGVSVNA